MAKAHKCVDFNCELYKPKGNKVEEKVNLQKSDSSLALCN